MIKVENLTKKYGGLRAVDNLSMEIPAGEMMGFIGPNGAGKTTTMKIMATLLTATSGRVTIDGLDVARSPAKVREILGYMPDFCGVYEDMRVREYLAFFGAAYGIEPRKMKNMVDDVLQLTDLTGKADAMADSLSRGMQQRLQLARVLLHDPKVLLLDEPASGLDPRARIEIRMLLLELKKMGKTILISSHILAELAELCSSIAIIEQGKLLYHGNVTEALERTRQMKRKRILICVAERQEEAKAMILSQDGIKEIEELNGTLHVESENGWDTGKFFDLLTGGGFRLTRLENEQASLEDAFMHLTEGRVS